MLLEVSAKEVGLVVGGGRGCFGWAADPGKPFKIDSQGYNTVIVWLKSGSSPGSVALSCGSSHVDGAYYTLAENTLNNCLQGDEANIKSSEHAEGYFCVTQ